ncbi:RNA polymerase sigma-70 factor, ECF subfamily [Amycolatopsis pretoriensis]|uniref:RNA polymerase sigma-70 factor, ECF subfamily n=1 Tax=Amycolatopsis pretoriensis TaxID=218821 RepID=A0A1H5QDY5_9PSEU|nr:RNA polymerase sigma-70 factor, ECF subfamily [Amycolatopsis pretoriensis]
MTRPSKGDLSTLAELFAALMVTASAEGIDQALWMMNPGKLTAATAV